jgi:hypothetical protein
VTSSPTTFIIPTLSIMGIKAPLSMNVSQNNVVQIVLHFEIVMLCAAMLNVVMLCVAMPSVVMPSGVVPQPKQTLNINSNFLHLFFS